MSTRIEKAVNFKKLSKLTALPKEILKTFVKQLVKQNKSNAQIVNFYIDFLIFLHETNSYVPNEVIVSYYKEKTFIDFKPLIEDADMMEKFRERNELKTKDLEKNPFVKTNPEDAPLHLSNTETSPTSSPK